MKINPLKILLFCIIIVDIGMFIVFIAILKDIFHLI